MPISTTGSSSKRVQQERSCLCVGGDGFTLMELVVVMVLLSLLTAFAVPRIRTTLFTDQLKAGGRRLIGLISETGQEARRTHQPWLIEYDPALRRFTARPERSETPDSEGSGSIRPYTLPPDIRLVDITTAGGGTRQEGVVRLRFSARGYVDQTLIHLAGDSGRNLTLVLSPFLGTIRVHDTYLDLEQERGQWQ